MTNPADTLVAEVRAACAGHAGSCSQQATAACDRYDAAKADERPPLPPGKSYMFTAAQEGERHAVDAVIALWGDNPLKHTITAGQYVRAVLDAYLPAASRTPAASNAGAGYAAQVTAEMVEAAYAYVDGEPTLFPDGVAHHLNTALAASTPADDGVEKMRAALADLLPKKLCGESWDFPDDETVALLTTFGKLRAARAALGDA